MRFLFFSLIVINANLCLAAPLLNSRDSLGRKQGFWHECDNEGCSDAYYVNDKIDGLFRRYSYKKKVLYLNMFGFYCMGNPSKTWYYFAPDGQLILEESNISIKNAVYIKGGHKLKYKFQSYIKEYYPNGKCKDEGMARYSDDVQVDFDKIGVWKYYNENGVDLRQ